MTTTKTCKKCLKTLTMDNFYIRNKKTNLRRTMCKVCMYEKHTKYREQHKEKISQQQKEYKNKNIDKIKNYLKHYNEKNKEELSKKKAEYYYKNVEYIREYNSKYYEKNKDHIIKQVLNYTRTEKGIISKKNTANRRRTIKRNGNIRTDQLLKLKQKSTHCYWCNKKLTDYHIDHYIPLSKGGTHTIENIVISCPTCNIKKSNKDPIDFALSVGKLL